MALESGDFLDDLVRTNPTGTDPRSQGDDHIRLLKTVLQNTFPDADGPFLLKTFVDIVTDQLIDGIKTFVGDYVYIKPDDTLLNPVLRLLRNDVPSGAGPVGNMQYRAMAPDIANPGQYLEKAAFSIVARADGTWTDSAWPGSAQFQVGGVAGGSSQTVLQMYSNLLAKFFGPVEILNAVAANQPAALGQVVTNTGAQTVLGEKIFQAEQLVSAAALPANTQARLWIARGFSPAAENLPIGTLAWRALNPVTLAEQQANAIIGKSDGAWSDGYYPSKLEIVSSPLQGSGTRVASIVVRADASVEMLNSQVKVAAPVIDSNPATKKYVDDTVTAGAKIVASARVTAGGAAVALKGCTMTKQGTGRWRMNYSSNLADLDKVLILATIESSVTTANTGPMINYGSPALNYLDIATRTGGSDNQFTDAGFSVMVVQVP